MTSGYTPARYMDITDAQNGCSACRHIVRKDEHWTVQEKAKLQRNLLRKRREPARVVG